MNDVVTPEEISRAMRALQQRRWAKTTPEQKEAWREQCKINGKKGAEKRWGKPTVQA